VEFFHTNNNN